MERIIRALVKEHAKELKQAIDDFNVKNGHLLVSGRASDIALYLANVNDAIDKAINDLIS